MKKTAALLLILALPAQAALPPQYQNRRDLEVMLAFIQQHPRIEAGLNAIDLDAYTVRYERECIASFIRDVKPKPPGWVGPLDPIVFKSSNCDLGYRP
ncbi:hypothetical protein [Arenimonas sp.]|jgi:hypothetical protein|uniref:hypothetical protein n=1 Tax=Arenimonas sp. TaxID=1872635 RepID=UPI0037BFA0FA